MSEERVVLVTGASRGIGAAIAQGLAEDGHKVAFAARNPADVQDKAKWLGGMTVPLDVADPASVAAAVAQVEATLGPIDVLVNNAGVALSAPFARTTAADWAQTLAVNLTGSFHVTQAVVPGMQARGFGRLVFIASNAGLTGYAYTAAYCASKHGVVGLMRALAVELAKHGVTSNAICPGFVETDMARASIDRIMETTGRTEEEARAALAGLSPQRRLIQVEEVVHAVRALLPASARGINGQAIAVDGGQVLH
ncbi:MAG: SDR family oxidoreductase [Myxococcales bacterium]|nr:SDR family oxidoreductase [Myxococcales bacterium]